MCFGSVPVCNVPGYIGSVSFFQQQLEIELKKLQVLNDERQEQFDEVVYALFERKVKSEMVIFQVSVVP